MTVPRGVFSAAQWQRLEWLQLMMAARVFLHDRGQDPTPLEGSQLAFAKYLYETSRVSDLLPTPTADSAVVTQ